MPTNSPSAKTHWSRGWTHIRTLVGRYKGRIHIWDVVNEAIEDDDKGWRQSPWTRIIGPEFMERAFRVAHETDPKATLLYNDYNEHNPGKRAFLVGVLKDYRKRKVPIHGVGFQGHVGLDYPDLAEYRAEHRGGRRPRPEGARDRARRRRAASRDAVHQRRHLGDGRIRRAARPVESGAAAESTPG